MLADVSMSPKTEVPEPGQVVEVRGSTWAVANVTEQGLLRSPADEGAAEVTHVVELLSLDEDRRDEQLRVVWELEVGISVNPAQGLPQGITSQSFDEPGKLAAFVDALRWGAVTSARADRFQAPFWSGAAVEAYQLEPLRRALSAPRTNLLLADDVGLGKTVEAGLVIQELLLRHRARTVVIVCPPSLSLKWQDEMRDKFGLDFEIINTEKMAEVRRSHGLQANPFSIFPRVIVSMAWLSSTRAQRMLREVYQSAEGSRQANRYAFDILVVDEAHHVAPSSPSSTGNGRGYAVDSQRTVATRALAEHCEHRLFLSATPHNGHSESFTALLEMIDSRRFVRGADINKEALSEVTVRRLKSDLASQNFKKRVVKPLAFVPSAEEQEKFAELESIIAASRKGRGKKSSGDIVSLLLKKRFFSSAYAFGKSVQNFLAAEGGTDEFDEFYDDQYYDLSVGDGASDEEEGLFTHPEAEILREAKGAHVLSAASQEQLEQLANWGLGFENTPDSRAEQLIELLDGVCRAGSDWTNERVVVFTEYAHTVQWLQRVLEARGYGADRLSVIQGSTDVEQRELIRARFNADPAKEPVRVLLATDAAGEGIDLQNYCYRLVNFDIPFNPSRLEQRIGRIDRYGQRQNPQVFHFVPSSGSSTFSEDMRFLESVAKKVANVEYDLGSVNQVVSEEIQQQFLKGPSSRKKRKPQHDPNAVINEALAGGLELNKQLSRLTADVQVTREKMHLEPQNLRRVVDTALAVNNQQLLVPNFDFVAEDVPDAEVFDVPLLTQGWHHTLRGLADRLQPEVQRPITFDSEFAAQNSDVVYVHLGHPLVQKSQRLLRAALWGNSSALNRVTAVVVPGLEESVAVAVVRMALVGRGGVRLHEDVFLAGVRLTGARTKVAEDKTIDVLELALDDGQLELADETIREELVQLWAGDSSPLQQRLADSIEQRAGAKAAEVEKQLRQREASDVERVEKIFGAFQKNLEDSLKRISSQKNQEQQTMLFVDKDQERQWRRDVRAMESRLDSLGEEKARELEAVRLRYVDVKPHVTAAALVFAVSDNDAKVWGK